MNIDIIKDIINLIKNEEYFSRDILIGEEPQFSDRRYSPYPLSKKNVKKFSLLDNNSKVCFIDGGNIELFSSPTFYLGLVRIYFNIFRNNKICIPKKIPQKYEFYVFGKAISKGNDIDFNYKLFPFNDNTKVSLNEEDMTIGSHDPSISSQFFRAELGSVCGIARRFLEWKVSEIIIDEELSSGDVIVRDGSLQTAIKGESKYSDRAYTAAEKKHVTFCGVAKRSKLYTTKGRSLTYTIKLIGNKIYPNEMWYYYPVADINHSDHKAEMYFVKFHPFSNYIFRFEIEKDRSKILGEKGVEEILGLIASNSVDLRFPGYPFGLVDADYVARLRDDEMETHKALFMSQCDDDNLLKFINDNISVEDAHDILDSLQWG